MLIESWPMRTAGIRTVATQALTRGVEFLLQQQGADGLWRDFHTPAGEASLWPTGFIATSLVTSGSRKSLGALRRAAHSLMAYQDSAGGWGYNENVPSDADSTACALLFLGTTNCPLGVRERAAAFLLKHQQREDGGIATFNDSTALRQLMGAKRWISFRGWCQPHLEVTAMAGRALSSLGPSREEAVLRAWRFIGMRQQADGSWPSYWWSTPHFGTLQAVEMASLMGDRASVRRAGIWAARNQKVSGAWEVHGGAISAFATALSLSILVHAREGREAWCKALQALAGIQQPDGGWPILPILRIPLPGTMDPDRRRPWPVKRWSSGVVLPDQQGTFTSAACVMAIASALRSL